jgi:integrase/recombinase XerD
VKAAELAGKLDPRTALRGDVREAWAEFRDDHEAQNHSPRTVETYGAAVAQLQLWLDQHRAATDILTASGKDIAGYLAWCSKKSGSTAANRYRGLVQFYKYATAEGIVTDNLMANVKCPKHEHKMPEVVPDDQLIRLIASVEKDKTFNGIRDAAIIRIFCEPGSPRASEMTGMDLDDFDMEAKTIIIRNGKGDKMRVIGMSPSTAKAVFRYRRARAQHKDAQGTQAMWLGMKGPVTRFGLGQMLHRRCGGAGVPRMHCHQLRHTAFADFDDQNGNVSYEMALFGWSSPAMAHHYGKSARAQCHRGGSADAARRPAQRQALDR